MESLKQTGGKVVRKRKGDKDAKPKNDKDALKKQSGGGNGVFLAENREKIVKTVLARSNVITDTTKTLVHNGRAFPETRRNLTMRGTLKKWKITRLQRRSYATGRPTRMRSPRKTRMLQRNESAVAMEFSFRRTARKSSSPYPKEATSSQTLQRRPVHNGKPFPETRRSSARRGTPRR